MGYAHGIDDNGREVGYAVSARCDLEGCDTAIDRGLDYCCGGMPDGDEHGCGGYFCHRHLSFALTGDDTPQLCDTCLERYERRHPEEVDG